MGMTRLLLFRFFGWEAGPHRIPYRSAAAFDTTFTQ